MFGGSRNGWALVRAIQDMYIANLMPSLASFQAVNKESEGFKGSDASGVFRTL